MTFQIDMGPISAIDLTVRSILLFLTVMVFVEFYSVYGQPNGPGRTRLLRGILWVVGTTGASVAYYLAIASLERDAYMAFLDWGVIVQIPRVIAMIYLLKVMRGGKEM